MLRGIPVDPSRTPYRLMADGSVVVEDARKFPFIQKGLPRGQKAPEIITPNTYKPTNPK